MQEELDGESVVAKFATTAKDGKTYQVEYYDLDMIMSIGYLSNRSSGVTATIYTRQLNQQQQLDLQRHNQQYPPIDIHNYHIIVEHLNYKTMDELQNIQNLIYVIRGQRVMLDRDLAKAYGVETKVLNQAVKRNIKRFEGEDYMFQLTKEECLRSQIVTLNEAQGKHLKYMPYAFKLKN